MDIETKKEGELVLNANLKNDRFIVGKSNFVPGFDGNLLGRRSGETAVFSVTAPESYWQKDLRGKKIDFIVKVNGVFERRIPELSDEFAKGLGPNFASLDDLRKNVSEGILIEKQNEEREKMRIKMIDDIVKDSNIDPPEIMILRTLENMIQEFKPLLGRGEKSDADLKTELRSRARHNVSSNLVIYEILKRERLEPTMTEIEEEGRKHRADGAQKEDGRALSDYLYGILVNSKVFSFLDSLG